MKFAKIVEKFRATANRCRHLAATATDDEVAQELLQIAEEIEAALPLVRDYVRHGSQDDQVEAARN